MEPWACLVQLKASLMPDNQLVLYFFCWFVDATLVSLAMVKVESCLLKSKRISCDDFQSCNEIPINIQKYITCRSQRGVWNNLTLKLKMKKIIFLQLSVVECCLMASKRISCDDFQSCNEFPITTQKYIKCRSQQGVWNKLTQIVLLVMIH